MKNLGSILTKGILKSSFENGVYLTDSTEAAFKWIAIRSSDDILVIEVEVEESKIILGCDHSQIMVELTGGESYIYQDDIELNKLKKFIKYEQKEETRN